MVSEIASRSSAACTSAMSSSARASSCLATSSSGGCKQAPLLQGMTHDMAPGARIALGLLVGIDDHVYGRLDPPQGPAQPHHLRVPPRNLGFDDEEIEIAVRAGIPSRVRAEKKHARARARLLSQAFPRPLDEFLGNHERDGTAAN
jgi:hypothetical protein